MDDAHKRILPHAGSVDSTDQRFFGLPNTGSLYPQCPYCGKVDTLRKVGKFYCCRSCRRLTLKFNWNKPPEKK